MEFEIDDIASIGGVSDVPSYMLPPEAWTLALNMRYEDDGLQSLDGWGQVFGTPLYPPHFAMPVATPSTQFWVYTSLTKAAVWDGTSHTDITRVAGDYTATQSYEWNGTILGGIPILNNPNDIPQYWAPQTPATKLQNLTAWPATKRCRIMRAFGPFLIAFSTIEGGSLFPHRMLWSHPADPGTLPVSWDIADPTKDAGQLDLPDVQSGLIVDALPLGQNMYIYKESSVWRVRYVGGQSIFDPGQSAWLTTVGLLGPRCVCISGDGTKHICATQDDIIWHNGNTVNSILDKRQRRRLQGDLDTTNFGQSFIWPNPFKNEIWFCYPKQGSQFPDRALILNYKKAGSEEFVVTEADGITFRNAAVGNIESFASEIWDTGTDTWNDPTGPWGQLERRKVILCNPAGSKFYSLGTSPTRDGVAIASVLRREGLALVGKKRDGGVVVDHQRWKLLKRLWPKITGGPVSVRFGSQVVVNGPVTWGTPATFDPATMVFVDPGPISGRAVGFEFSSSGLWRTDGYKIDMVPMGQH